MMSVAIIEKPLRLTIHGFSGLILNKDYAGTGIRLMDRMWKVVSENGLKNKGLNIWVYDENDMLFAGVELEAEPGEGTGLERKEIELMKYASYKHYDAYEQTSNATRVMMDELKRRGIKTGWPYLEMYGHQGEDDSKPETELLVSLK